MRACDVVRPCTCVRTRATSSVAARRRKSAVLLRSDATLVTCTRACVRLRATAAIEVNSLDYIVYARARNVRTYSEYVRL